MTMWETSQRLHPVTKVITYQYDELNQLIRENNGVLGTTVLYAYDAGGNMTSRKTYAYTEGAVSTVQTQDLFTYRTEGWKDQLLSWNGKSYAYDAGGNPTGVARNGTDLGRRTPLKKNCWNSRRGYLCLRQ